MKIKDNEDNEEYEDYEDLKTIKTMKTMKTMKIIKSSESVESIECLHSHHQNPSTAWNHHPSSFFILVSYLQLSTKMKLLYPYSYSWPYSFFILSKSPTEVNTVIWDLQLSTFQTFEPKFSVRYQVSIGHRFPIFQST